MKTAIIVLSDPKAGSDEALGRLFNALATTFEHKQRGDDVRLVFQGAGTRWLGEITRDGHPARELFDAVADRIAGYSHACAVSFGAADAAEESGHAALADNAVPGTPGLASLRQLLSDGYAIVTF